MRMLSAAWAAARPARNGRATPAASAPRSADRRSRASFRVFFIVPSLVAWSTSKLSDCFDVRASALKGAEQPRAAVEQVAPESLPREVGSSFGDRGDNLAVFDLDDLATLGKGEDPALATEA